MQDNKQHSISSSVSDNGTTYTIDEQFTLGPFPVPSGELRSIQLFLANWGDRPLTQEAIDRLNQNLQERGQA